MFQKMARSLHARNPFYLLSAVSMLAGCFALSRALTAAPGQWKPLVALMGVLQLYEFVLLGLAVLLYRRIRMPSDARMAFLLGLLFVSDSTYLNTELATSNPWAAPWVALAHLAFLVPKLIFLRDTLGLTSLRTLALTVAQVAFLVFIPGTFSAVHFMDSKVHAQRIGIQLTVRNRKLGGLVAVRAAKSYVCRLADHGCNAHCIPTAIGPIRDSRYMSLVARRRRRQRMRHQNLRRM